MASRPLHLRWLYIRQRPFRYLTLTILTVMGAGAAMMLLADPAGGMAAGAVFTTGVWFGWKASDRARYPDRSSAPIESFREAA